MEQCKTDSNIFRRIVGEELGLILAVYVDDIRVGLDKKGCDGLRAKLAQRGLPHE